MTEKIREHFYKNKTLLPSKGAEAVNTLKDKISRAVFTVLGIVGVGSVFALAGGFSVLAGIAASVTGFVVGTIAYDQYEKK